jgi:hypothetical protein
MEKSPASANAYGSAKRGCRCLDRGGYHGEGGDKERPGEGRGGPELAQPCQLSHSARERTERVDRRKCSPARMGEVESKM